MGICGSKEARGSSPTALPNSTEPKVQKKPPTSNKRKDGHRLGSSTETEKPDLSAKDLAAKAAQERFDQEKKKNETGQLGKKLAVEKKKTSKDHALETYTNKNKTELVYD
ncbi:hypothetical protein OGAPHI_003525 [Ogataea philodendri]|uniref:YGL108C-like protein n=1 Tax=Ogataea philodendri TaxID=1378263 RepID=A0A9P8T516_9ASCO|nr:uncharacterized protein OGAPHI_003525 [Ogataea philodendri]KAH3666528.1 hypothetical protein OGAPHI_003525 [Ogataea philodendri]